MSGAGHARTTARSLPRVDAPRAARRFGIVRDVSTPPALVLLDGDLTITPMGGYLRIWHRRPARTRDELHQILSTIDGELATRKMTRLVFDSRESKYEAGDVQTDMWAWLTSHPTLTRVATLVESELLATSVNMTGLSKGVKIKAFHDEATAVGWVLR